MKRLIYNCILSSTCISDYTKNRVTKGVKFKAHTQMSKKKAKNNNNIKKSFYP